MQSLKRLFHRVTMWLGHYQLIVFLVTLVPGLPRPVLRAIGFKDGSTVLNVLSVLSVAHWVTLAALFFATFYAIRYHDRNLCLLDIQESPVLDPQGAVERRRRPLRSFHWYADSRRRLMLVVWATLGPSLVIATVQALIGAKGSPAWLWAYAGTHLAVMTVLTYLIWAQAVHRKLKPWCPQCEHGGRGPRFRTTPEPVTPPGKPEPRLV